MALAKQKINLSFAQGVDTKSDPKQVIPGKLLTLENGVFQKTGSLIKRNGYTKLTEGSLTEGIGLSTFKDELFMISGQATYDELAGRTYSPSRAAWSGVKGYYTPVQVSRVSAANTSGLTAPYAVVDSCVDSVTNLEMIVYMRETSATTERIFYSVRDLTTGAFIVQDQVVSFSAFGLTSPGSYFRVVKFNNDFVIICSGVTTSTAKLFYIRIPVATISTPSTEVVIVPVGTATGEYAADTPFDAIVDNNILYLSFANGTANKYLSLLTISSSYVISAVTTLSFNAVAGSTIVADSSNNVWIASNSGGATTAVIRVTSYTSNLASQRFAPFDVESTTTGRSNVVGLMDPTDATKIWLYWTDDGASGSSKYTDPPRIRYSSVTYTSGTPTKTGPSELMYNGALYAKPYKYNNQIRLPISCYDGVGTYTYFVIGLQTSSGTQTPYVDAKLSVQSGNALRGNPISTWLVGTETYYFQLVEKNEDANGYLAYSYKLSYDHKPVFAELANNLHITGGFIYMYDGKNLCEHNFFTQPSILTSTTATTGGSVAAGTYYYCYTYEWVDAYGQLHISAPSDPSTALTTTGSTSVNTLTIPCLNLSNRTSYKALTYPISIGVYRSSDGINYYKNVNTGVNGSLYNSINNATVTFSDTYSDAQAYSGQPLLYTVGGEVPNLDPGAVNYLASYNQRLIAIPSEAPSSWWYSKEIVPPSPGNAGTPVQFSNEFISVVDERAGGITGIQQMDEKLLFFKKNNIFALSGNGPASDGSGSDFNPPQVIATDTGCLDNQSIVLGPSGIMFKSAKGIYLIDRSLSVSYIGAPVEAYNSYTVLSADLIYDLNQFRFGLSNGQALVYNYLFDQWSVFTNHSILQACIYQNKYTYCTSAALVYQENSAYTDDGTGYALKITTSWLSFADLQGFQRVYKILLLGEWKSNHQLQVKVAYDFVDTATQTTAITVFNTPPYEWRLFLARQKCTSIKFTIEDISGGTLNESYQISAIGFEVGIKQGLNKLAASRSAG